MAETHRVKNTKERPQFVEIVAKLHRVHDVKELIRTVQKCGKNDTIIFDEVGFMFSPRTAMNKERQQFIGVMSTIRAQQKETILRLTVLNVLERMFSVKFCLKHHKLHSPRQRGRFSKIDHRTNALLGKYGLARHVDKRILEFITGGWK